jgi:crotonobetainyl-CoA:carnitine CoA-transferase CaiB-like acyl-CoA transferase
VITLTRFDEAEPRPLTPLDPTERPLTGLRVLDLTRILAGPICGRTLAGYGAVVLLINSPHLPNISSIVDTSRGKHSAHLDLRSRPDRDRLAALAADAHVFVQGYRPGGMAALGLSPGDLARIRPGIVYVTLSAYGSEGPWRDRRGFDSLVQAATGFNHAEALAAGAEQPQSLPVPILDFASGFLMAFGAQAALLRQCEEGGSWHVEVSLAATARWLRGLGRRENGFARKVRGLGRHLAEFPCTSGKLMGMPHGAELSRTPVAWTVASAPPGTHPPAWD